MLQQRGFKEEELSLPSVRTIRGLARQVRGDVLRMAQLAGDVAPGASLSVVEVLLTLLASAEIDPADPDNPKRDRIVLSHENATAPFYAALGRLDYLDLDDAVCLYRKAGSIFEGHAERAVPGVPWNCGNPGQGLGIACGMALAARWGGHRPNLFVVMSDEEQQRGEVSEARRFAKKYRLNNITVLIDANNVQAGGKTSEVMPQNLKYEFIADGWDVIEINGHDPSEIYQAVRRASQIQSTPVLVLANTIMGHGISFMENQPEYYVRPLTDREYAEGMSECGESDDLTEASDYRTAFGDFDIDIWEEAPVAPEIEMGEPITYDESVRMTNLEAMSAALSDLAELNSTRDHSALALFDCGHGQSLQTLSFAQKHHELFLQCGLGIHAAVSVASAMGTEGVVAMLADMGVHNLAEAYNQLRLADINNANLKLVATHTGLSAAGAGKAMHSLDYIGLAANLFGFHLIVPADPNETDRAMRFMAAQPGNWIMALGAGEAPVITNKKGTPLLAPASGFSYGKITKIRGGESGVILTTGQLLSQALEVWTVLNKAKTTPSLYHVSAPLTIGQKDDPVLQKELRKGRVITFEEHNVRTGLGSRVANVIAQRGISCRHLPIGVERFSLSGEVGELRRLLGLDVETVAARAKKFLKR